MIEGLPNRKLTEKEVDQLSESDHFENIYIRGYALTPQYGEVDKLVITLADGTEKEIGYFIDDGWQELKRPCLTTKQRRVRSTECENSVNSR